MKKFRNQKGFSLIELMIVVLIIGLLLAVASPFYRDARRQAEERAFDSNVRQLKLAGEMFVMDNPRTEVIWSPFAGQKAVKGDHPLHDSWNNYIDGAWPVIDKSRPDVSFSVEIDRDGNIKVSPESYEF